MLSEPTYMANIKCVISGEANIFLVNQEKKRIFLSYRKHTDITSVHFQKGDGYKNGGGQTHTRGQTNTKK